MRAAGLKMTAAALVILMAMPQAAFAGDPPGNGNGNGHGYGHQDDVNVTIDAYSNNENHNANTNNNSNNNANTNTANGGDGGTAYGGEGGSSTAYGGVSTATGGSSTATGGSSNATGGNATGGTATGGSATGGSATNSNENSADNSLTQNNTTTNSADNSSYATGGSSSADNNGNNNGNNGNNNSSSSNAQEQSQSLSNDTSSSNNSSQEVNVNSYEERDPVNTAFAAPLMASEDTCMGSSSIGAQAVTFGVSIGTTWQDSNCRRLKNSRQLVALGYHRAATALMCVDEDVRNAMEEAGTPCPSRNDRPIVPVAAAIPTPPPCPATEFVVPFEWDRSNLNRTAVNIIDEAVARARQCNVNGVVVIGHTDTSGSSAYNEGLSQRRAVVVRNAMIDRGVSADLIETNSRGETDLARQTADNVREQANRRTAVTISFR